MVEDIRDKVRSYHKSMIMQNKISHRVTTITVIDWKKPERDLVYINLNRAVEKNNATGHGGFAWNINGNWLCEFSKSVGICNMLTTKI